MKINKLFPALAIAASFSGFTQSAEAAIKTDVIMIVDESGSMGTVQANLRDNIGLFANILSTGGVDAQYGLVGYGNSSVVPHMLTDLTSAANFATAAQGLVASGGTEPGYTASAFALNALDGQSSLFNFRADAIINLIIFTDEPHNGSSAAYGTVGASAVTAAILDQLLTDSQALYNAVLSGNNTISSYGPLATSHSGAVFDLTLMNTTDQTIVQNFVTDFANAKLHETLDFCLLHPTDPKCVNTGVPEPSSLALLGIGIFGFGSVRRRCLLALAA